VFFFFRLGDDVSTLFALGFLLFVITFVVLAAAKAMINRAEKAKGS
jgi:phosphate transport system permease protein